MKEISKLITVSSLILGLTLFIGGFIIAILNINSPSKMNLLGQELNTGSVGLAFIVAGVIMVFFLYNKVLKIAPEIPVEANTDFKMYVLVHEKGSETDFIENAIVKLTTKPEPLQKETDVLGNAILFFNKKFEGQDFYINAEKEGYKKSKPKKIKLQNDKQEIVELQKDKNINEPNSGNYISKNNTNDPIEMAINLLNAYKQNLVLEKDPVGKMKINAEIDRLEQLIHQFSTP